MYEMKNNIYYMLTINIANCGNTHYKYIFDFFFWVNQLQTKLFHVRFLVMLEYLYANISTGMYRRA